MMCGGGGGAEAEEQETESKPRFSHKRCGKNRHDKNATLNQCKSWHGLLRLQFAKWAGGVVLGAKIIFISVSGGILCTSKGEI
jgi:hypothetical protein